MGVTKREGRLPVNIRIQGTTVKQMANFKYLASVIEEEGRGDAEIKARIARSKIV